jgi:hypothetical protein
MECGVVAAGGGAQETARPVSAESIESLSSEVNLFHNGFIFTTR